MKTSLSAVFCLLVSAFAYASTVTTPPFDHDTFIGIRNTTGTDIICAINYYNLEHVALGPEAPFNTFTLPASASWSFSPALRLPELEGPAIVIPDRPRGFVDNEYTGTAVIMWVGGPECIELFESPIDTTAPVITLMGDNPLHLVEGEPFVDPGASATDDTDGNITSRITVTGTVDNLVPGMYELSYTVSDNAGNHASITRTVYVYPTGGVTLCVDATGGMLQIPGISVSIPPDAMPSPATLLLKPISAPSLNLPLNQCHMGPGFTYAVSGLEVILNAFSVTVTVEYPDDNNDQILDGTSIPVENLCVFTTYNGKGLQTLHGELDTVNKTITVEIPGSLLPDSKGTHDLAIVLGANTGEPLPIETMSVALSLAAAALWRLRRKR